MTSYTVSSGSEGSSVSTVASVAESVAGFHFDDLPTPKDGLQFENLLTDDMRGIPLDLVAGMLRMTVQAVFGYLRDFGTLSCVVTQNMDTATSHFKRHPMEENDQVIICGYGNVAIPGKPKTDGVCRHNAASMKIMNILRVDKDSRTRDSIYAVEGGLRSYIGIRLEALPECTVCILFVDKHATESQVEHSADILSSVVSELNDSLKHFIDNYLAKVDVAALEASRLRTHNTLLYVSHEIRNQLVPWSFFLEDVEDGESKELMTSTLSTVNHILTRILKMGKTMDDSEHVAFKYFNLDCVLRASDRYIMNATHVKYERTFNCDKRLFILADEHNTKQCISNLLSNAVKFTKQGKITLSGNIEYTPRSPNKLVLTICITDTGKGVAKDKLHTVLKPFGQADISNASSGAGLGLHLCQTMVETLHKGRLTFESEGEGKGSMVTMSFPALYKMVPLEDVA